MDKLLKDIGLNNKESRILLYLYEKGKSKASSISREESIPKSTVLFILYKLEEKGLVSRKKKGKAYIFESTDPENLLKFIDSNLEDFQMKRRKLVPKIPTLRKLKDLKSDEIVHFYDKESSITELKHSINERFDNEDIRRIYSKNYKSIYRNEDFTFLVTDSLAIRFIDKEILKKFILALKDIDEKQF